MAGSKPRYTKEQVIAALESVNGMMFLAAKSLHCNVETIRNYRKRYKEVAAVFEQKRGEFVDIAESALYRGVLAGDAWAVCFALKTQGKERGYVERTETTGKDGAPLHPKTVTIVRPAKSQPLDENGFIPRQSLNGSTNGASHG